MKRLLTIAWGVGWLGTALVAQGAAPAAPAAPAPAAAAAARLQELLGELRATEAAAWAARLAELEQRAKARDAEAEQLRQQAKALEQRAAGAAAAAKALRDEQARVRELQALVAGLPAGGEGKVAAAKPEPAKAGEAGPAKPAAPAAKAAPPAAAVPQATAGATAAPAPKAAAAPKPAAPKAAEPAPPSGAAPKVQPAPQAAAAPKAEPAPPSEAAAAPAAAPKREAAPKPAPAAASAPAAAPPVAPAKPAAPAPAAPSAAPAPAKELAASELVTWPRVAPLFADHCTSCHDPTDQKGGLDLSTFAATRAGGGSGQSIVPGAPDQSRLYRMVAQQERPFMPRNADPLGKDLVQLLRTWIEHGAAADEAGARAFLAEQAAAARAAAADAAPAAADAAAPLPDAVPPAALRTAARPGPVTSLVRSPRAPLLALPGLQQLLLCDAELQPLAVVPCELPHCGPVAFAEDGSAVLVAGGEPGRRGAAGLYDVRTGALLARCGDERDVPLAAAVHRGAGLVALGGAGKSVRVQRLADGGEAMVGKHDDFVLGLSFAPDGQRLAAADRAGAVVVWEPRGGRVFQTLAGHRGAVHAVAFDRSGKSVVSAGADGTVRLWDVEAGRERWRQNAHAGAQALAVCFGPGGTVASCGSDGVIATFSAAGAPGARSAAAGEWLYAVAFGADDKVVFAGDWLGRVHRWEVGKKGLGVRVVLGGGVE